MPLTLEKLVEEAMHLSPDSRAELAERLMESLVLPGNSETQSLWIAEAERRYDELASGKVKGIPGEDVLTEMHRLVGR